MNSFEQIRSEKETKEKIEELQKIDSKAEVERRNELEDQYGEQHPAKIIFWKLIWDDYNLEYTDGLPKSAIKKTAAAVHDLSHNKADEIADIGKNFGLLVESDPEEAKKTNYINNITDKTILRLVLPEERPNLYVDNPKQYAERETWSEIWGEMLQDESAVINYTMLKNTTIYIFNLNSETESRAAIEIGKMSKAIKETEDGYTIADPRPREYWLDVWCMCEEPPEKTLTISRIEQATKIKDGDISRARKIVSAAVESGELYSPPENKHHMIAINDPATNEGPEIDKANPPTDEENKDGADEEDIQPSQSSNESVEQPTVNAGSSDDGVSIPEMDVDIENSDQLNNTTGDSEPMNNTSSGSTSDTEFDSTPNDFEDIFKFSDQDTGDKTQADSNKNKSGHSVEQTNQSEEVDVIKERHRANLGLEDELEPAIDVEEGVNFHEVMEKMQTDDKNDNFKTYTSPDIDNDEYDLDRQAIKQFVADFANIDVSNKTEVKVSKDRMLNAIFTWSKINSLKLNKLSKDTHVNQRKGKLKNVLQDEYDIDSKKVSIEGERVRGFAGIELSDSGEELFGMNVDEISD